MYTSKWKNKSKKDYHAKKKFTFFAVGTFVLVLIFLAVYGQVTGKSFLNMGKYRDPSYLLRTK
jgi:hypothetical protein